MALATRLRSYLLTPMYPNEDPMRTTSCICDKCGEAILEKASMLEIKGSGDIRLVVEKIDLCAGCATRFIEFLRTRPGQTMA
jgi:hypothetical protein